MKFTRIKSDSLIPIQETGRITHSLYASETVYLEPGETKPVTTGLKFEVGKNEVGVIFDSSVFNKQKIHRFARILHLGHTGEVTLWLYNSHHETFWQKVCRWLVLDFCVPTTVINYGDKIGELLIFQVEPTELQEVKNEV